MCVRVTDQFTYRCVTWVWSSKRADCSASTTSRLLTCPTTTSYWRSWSMLLSDNPLASSLFESISVPTRTKAQCPIALSTLVCHFYLLRVKESVRLHTGMECTMETSNHACQQHTTTSYEVRCTGRIGDRCFIGNRLPWVTASIDPEYEIVD